jgi:hypothetical protein
MTVNPASTAEDATIEVTRDVAWYYQHGKTCLDEASANVTAGGETPAYFQAQAAICQQTAQTAVLSLIEVQLSRIADALAVIARRPA